jgi:hypothetical protein
LVAAGPGRTDAFGAILNRLAGRALGILKNLRPATAPVSFPMLWGAWILRWAQYTGSAGRPLERNIGEVFGVHGRIKLDPSKPTFLASTVRFEALVEIEELLRKLKPPRWSQVFGVEPDATRAALGRAIYLANCDVCHKLQPVLDPRTDFGGELETVTLANVIPRVVELKGGIKKELKDEIRTDAVFMLNLMSHGKDDMGALANQSLLARKPEVLGKLQFDNAQVRSQVMTAFAAAPKLQPQDNAGALLGTVALATAVQFFAEGNIPIGSDRYYSITNRTDFKPPPNPLAYKARRLEGIFASAPYLHNGSVRTLKELLMPPDERVRTVSKFQIGTLRYDKTEVGYRSEGSYTFFTAKPGNKNGGHEFGTDLKPEEKELLIEFLKTL